MTENDRHGAYEFAEKGFISVNIKINCNDICSYMGTCEKSLLTYGEKIACNYCIYQTKIDVPELIRQEKIKVLERKKVI